jgi:hypothetical protein
VENTVSLLKYAIAAAAGYYAGQPGARRQVEQLWQKATDLAGSPKATELKQRGREIAGERASAAIGKVRGKSANDLAVVGGANAGIDTPTAGSATDAATGFSSRTVAEDTRAIRTGVLPPGPATGTADGV